MAEGTNRLPAFPYMSVGHGSDWWMAESLCLAEEGTAQSEQAWAQTRAAINTPGDSVKEKGQTLDTLSTDPQAGCQTLEEPGKGGVRVVFVCVREEWWIQFDGSYVEDSQLVLWHLLCVAVEQ